MSPTHYTACKLASSSRRYWTLVNDKEYSAKYIACECTAFGEEAPAAEAFCAMHPNWFTKRNEAQMDKYSMQEQAHYIYARLSLGTMAADLVLCMRDKGKGRFAEHVLQKTRGKGATLSSACSKKGGEGGEGAQKALGAFAYGEGHQAFAYQGGQEKQEEGGGTQEERRSKRPRKRA